MNKDKWIKYASVNSFANHFSLLYIYYTSLVWNYFDCLLFIYTLIN